MPSDRLDRLFKALADEYRRQVLLYFQTTADDTATVEELLAHTLEERATAKSQDQLELTFHHSTLPKLADLDVIEYDARSRTVRYSESPALEQVLDVVTEADQATE